MTKAKPTINYDEIEFPTDNITIKHLRSLKPRDDILCHDLEQKACEIGEMQVHEKDLALLGFVTEVGDPKQIARVVQEQTGDFLDDEVPTPEAVLQECRNILAKKYIEFGIADGPETAKMLVAKMEAMGAEQARKQLGRRH